VSGFYQLKFNFVCIAKGTIFTLYNNLKQNTMQQPPLTPEQLAYFQEVHYRQRIAQTNDPVVKQWLQKQLDEIIAIDDLRTFYKSKTAKS
jgi:hypothetical protein